MHIGCVGVVVFMMLLVVVVAVRRRRRRVVPRWANATGISLAKMYFVKVPLRLRKVGVRERRPVFMLCIREMDMPSIRRLSAESQNAMQCKRGDLTWAP